MARLSSSAVRLLSSFIISVIYYLLPLCLDHQILHTMTFISYFLIYFTPAKLHTKISFINVKSKIVLETTAVLPESWYPKFWIQFSVIGVLFLEFRRQVDGGKLNLRFSYFVRVFRDNKPQTLLAQPKFVLRDMR